VLAQHIHRRLSFLTATEARFIPAELTQKDAAENLNDKDIMTKRDLVMRVSETTGLPQEDVQQIVQKTVDSIAEAVSQGRKVELRNFGVFEVRVRKARIGRNPHDPSTDVAIPQRTIVKFKPGKELRELVSKLTPKEIKEARAQDRGRNSKL
jgi:nucleoid DNA-binding protein